jgi:4-aminobutyrate aminotransferase / (S)-3-amino-2-methylpropionate transaminase / 5-aminovalerate transaminase
MKPVKTRHRNMVAPLASEKSAKIIAALAKYEPRSMGHSGPVVWDRAVGYQVFDVNGNCWIDFTSAIILANAGHANPHICDAIKAQVDRQLLQCYCFPHEMRARLVQKLVEVSPPECEKVFLLTTGSEAVECAFKLTRMRGQTIHPRKIVMVSFDECFHGRTLGSQMLGGFPDQKKWIVNLDPDIHQAPYPFCFQCPWGKDQYQNCGAECFGKCLMKLREQGVDLNRIAGFITEPYRGYAAAFMPTDFVVAMRQWCDNNQALLIFDEVQAGFGRSGRLFSYEHYGVPADMICCGKGISGSLPLSAVMGRAEILDLPEPGFMSSTHTGNPVCCAAALANLEVFESEGLVARSAKLGQIMSDELNILKKQYPQWIAGIAGHGLVAGVLIVKPGSKELNIELADHVAGVAIQKGLLMLQTGRGALKIAPPLTIPQDALLEGLAVIRESLAQCIAESNEKSNRM